MSISTEDIKVAIRTVMSETKMDELKADIGDLKVEIAKVPGLIDTKIIECSKGHIESRRWDIRTMISWLALFVAAVSFLFSKVL